MTRPSPSESFTWPEVLAAAATPDELVGVVRDFLASWTPQEIDALPPSCRPPGKFSNPEDIVLYTFALVDSQMHSRIDDAGVNRMANFFSEATRRATHLLSQAEARAANGPEGRI